MRNDKTNRGDRKPVAAGRFYSASPDMLRSDLKALFSKVSDQQERKGLRAIISPHAGYVFSGVVAAAAFASVPPERKFSNIFIIGSSHRAAFNGASVYGEGNFITPLGRVPVNREIASALKAESYLFRHAVEVHDDEHSIEVQLPFIQYLFGNPPPVVPVLIGTDDVSVIKSLTTLLKPWFTSDNLFIISTDFSHYPSYSDATEADRETAEAILSGNPDKLIETLQKFRKAEIKGLSTNMCGWSAGLTLMYLTSDEKTLRYHHLLYRNSGDSQYGGKDGVVGYHSFVIEDEAYETDVPALGDEAGLAKNARLADEAGLAKNARLADEAGLAKNARLGDDGALAINEELAENAFLFTDDDRKILFKIARSSIVSGLKGEVGHHMSHSESSTTVSKPGGVFVTLYLNGQLRGCIGRIVSSEPICNNVAEMAFSAAFSDPRFPALTSDEYDMIEIEISVLSPLKRIYSKEEIIIGKHGLYMKREGRSGVLLPQVASERGWTVEQFLQHTARHKAGIGQDGWKDAELSVFETLILKENRSLGTVSNKQ